MSSDENKESEESAEDRLNYLLDRGVEISTPEERDAARKANASSVPPIFQQLSKLSQSNTDTNTNSNAKDGKVKFVLIPYNESRAMQTVTIPALFVKDHRGDVIPDFVKPYFGANKRSIDASLLQAQASKQLASNQGIKGANGKQADMSRVLTSAMNTVTMEGSVETFCLCICCLKWFWRK